MLTNTPPRKASSCATFYPCAIRGRCSNAVTDPTFSQRLEVGMDRRDSVANAITSVTKDSMVFILYE